MSLVLHSYFRSSTSIRLRAALKLKGLDYDYVSHHLRKGEHRDPTYLSVNPQGLVPALELDNGTALIQSLAIIEYLDETYPEPALLPKDALGRARVRAISQMIGCDIHPINNLRVLGYLGREFGVDQDGQAAWFRLWVNESFRPLETMLAASPETGRFCHGDAPGMADLCVYAQVWNNKRFDVDMAPYPTIARIFDACEAVPEIAAAAPMRQPDAE